MQVRSLVGVRRGLDRCPDHRLAFLPLFIFIFIFSISGDWRESQLRARIIDTSASRRLVLQLSNNVQLVVAGPRAFNVLRPLSSNMQPIADQ